MHRWIKKLVLIVLVLTLGFVTYIFGYSVGAKSAVIAIVNPQNAQAIAANLFEPLPASTMGIHVITGTVTSVDTNSITLHQLPDIISPYVFKNAPDIRVTVSPTTDVYAVQIVPNSDTPQRTSLPLSSFQPGQRIWVTSSDDLSGKQTFEATSVYRPAP